MDRVLITGGAGFIGSHLAEKLIERDYHVTTLDVAYAKNIADLDCEKIKGDICDYAAMREIVKNKDIVVHLAAVSRVELGQRNPRKCLKVNVLGTLTLLEVLRKKNPRAIMILGSSREVFGEPIYLPVDENHPKAPISVYGVSKLAADNLLLGYRYIYGLNFVILRLSNVYGSPRDLPERVIPKFMGLALKKETLLVYGGQQILDFTFIDDVINGILSVIDKIPNKGLSNNIFILASGKGTSIMELANLINKIYKSDSKVVIKGKRNYDVSRFIGNYQKAKLYFNYEPKYSLEEGLQIYRQRLMDYITDSMDLK